jgi:DNA-binding PadR family transcriptional regulator
MKLLSRNEEIILLAIIHLQQDAYGVTIRELVSDWTGQEWSFGAIYMSLDQLTRKELVYKTTSSPTAKRGGRSKCLYTLTPEGKSALREIRRVQSAMWKNIPKIAFE